MIQITYLILKNLLVVAELFHADRRADMMKLIAAFRKFGKGLKNKRRIHSFAKAMNRKQRQKYPLAHRAWGRNTIRNSMPKGEFLKTAEKDGSRSQKFFQK
jgi:hypothetical protein